MEKILTEHVEDLTSFREKLTALKSLLIEKLETTKKLDETILEIAKSRELEKEIEDSGEFCECFINVRGSEACEACDASQFP